MSETYNIIERLHSIKEAQALIEKSKLKSILGVEEIPIEKAIGRVASQTIVSPMDIPPMDRSVLDGYAVRWIDISVASEENPVILKVSGSIPIDSREVLTLKPNHALEVATGSPIPQGADTVIPVEYTRRVEGHVEIYKAFPGGYGISVKGEDLRKGEVLLRRGDVISEWHIGVISSVGIGRVEVWRPITAAIFATGTELIEPGSKWEPGKIYSSTTRAVYAYLSRRNVSPSYLGILPDDKDVIMNNIVEALAKYDIVITTGGTSVGKKDSTIKAIRDISDDIIHGLALTPGRPGAFALVDGKLVIALSGMPVAAISELIAVWDPVYRGFLGRDRPWEPVVESKLKYSFTSHPGMVNVVRARTCYSDGILYTSPLRVTGSGILSTFIKGNSFFIVDEELTGIDEGDTVEVRVTGVIERC